MTNRSEHDYSEYDYSEHGEPQPNKITARETPHSSHYDYSDTSMAEQVQNPEVEIGIPQDLSQGSSKGAKSLMWIGIALIGFALSALGTMKALSGSNEKVEEKPKAEEMIANKKKKDFSAERKEGEQQKPHDAEHKQKQFVVEEFTVIEICGRFGELSEFVVIFLLDRKSLVDDPLSFLNHDRVIERRRNIPRGYDIAVGDLPYFKIVERKRRDRLARCNI